MFGAKDPLTEAKAEAEAIYLMRFTTTYSVSSLGGLNHNTNTATLKLSYEPLDNEGHLYCMHCVDM